MFPGGGGRESGRLKKIFFCTQELNKLRLVALTYCMPELLDVVCTVLSKEEKASSNPNTQALLKQCVDFLRDNKNPQDKLVIK